MAKKAKNKDEITKEEVIEEIKEETEVKDEALSEEGVDEAEKNVSEKEYTELEQKYKELDDRYFRLAAEYTNFQRRTKEEKLSLYTNAVSDTITELLPIFDNLERAASSAAEAASAQTVAEGVKMVQKMAGEVLSKLGVEAIEAVGKEFDAKYHNAVMHIDDDKYGVNEVVEEFQKGYKCGDKVIRYSMVKVAN